MNQTNTMQPYKRQQKITTAFEKQTNRSDEEDEESSQILSDVREQKETLNKLELYLFELQRSCLPQPKQFRAKDSHVIREEVASMGTKIHMSHKYKELKSISAGILADFGIMLKEYTDKVCVIVFNITIKKQRLAHYAVQFALKDDKWELNKYHLPPCFNLEALAKREEIMSVPYISLMQEGLYSCHKRLLQITQLQHIVPDHVQIHPVNNTSFIEIIFKMVSRDSPDEMVDVVLSITYDDFQSLPKSYTIMQNIVDVNNCQVVVGKEQFEALYSFQLADAFFKSVRKCDENPFYCPNDEELADIIANRNRNYQTKRIEESQPDNIHNGHRDPQNDSDSDADSIYTHNPGQIRQPPKQAQGTVNRHCFDQEESSDDEIAYLTNNRKSSPKRPRGRSPLHQSRGFPRTNGTSDGNFAGRGKSTKTVHKALKSDSGKRIKKNQENMHHNDQDDTESQIYDPQEDESFIRHTKGSRAVAKAIPKVVRTTRLTSSFASSDGHNSSQLRRTSRKTKPKKQFL